MRQELVPEYESRERQLREQREPEYKEWSRENPQKERVPRTEEAWRIIKEYAKELSLEDKMPDDIRQSEAVMVAVERARKQKHIQNEKEITEVRA